MGNISMVNGATSLAEQLGYVTMPALAPRASVPIVEDYAAIARAIRETKRDDRVTAPHE